MEYDKATQVLIDDLAQLPPSPMRDAIIELARMRKFHDFDDEGYDAPKVALLGYLQEAGFKELAANAMDGKYDQGPEESAKWEEKMRKRDPSSARIFDAMKKSSKRRN